MGKGHDFNLLINLRLMACSYPTRSGAKTTQTSTLVLLWVEYLDYWIRSGTVLLVMPGIILLSVCMLEISYLQVYLFLAAVQGGDDMSY